MKKLLLLAIVLVCAGCGGGPGYLTTNPFSGSWSGSYSVADPVETGTMNLTISNLGNVSGTGVNTTESKSYTISGVIANTGYFSGALSGDISGTITGTLAITNTTHLTGTITETTASTTKTETIDLVYQ